MYIERRYKKLPWFDFLDQMADELKELPPKERYIDFLDELRMRKIESVSEGGTFKLKVPSQKLVDNFKQRMNSEPDFADPNNLKECERILDDIL